ncbi:MAG TPA: sigma-70 family RNA polymerase sigma factor [Candidatus Hydrogenedentes bacterium]|nr:sigma-70 family RNA polymerase sigma factor [Candidatus Hydrogenedentota bacterium]
MRLWTENRPDAQIVKRVLSGRRDDFGVLVRRYHRVVHAVAYAQLGNRSDAEDVAQDAFLHAFKSLDTLRESSKFRQWLLAIARNAASQLRRKHLNERARRDDTILDVPGPAPDLEERELHALLRTQIQKLDEGPREILLLHYFAGLKIREIGELLGISSDAAEKRLERARNALGTRMVRRLGAALEPEHPKRERTTRIMGVIAGVPAAWEGATAGTGLSGLASLMGGIVVMKKAVVGVVAALCVIAALFALNKAQWRKPVPASGDAADSRDRLVYLEEAPFEVVFPRPTLAAAPTPKPAAPDLRDAPAPGAVAEQALGSISGVVMDTKGKPLADMRVTAAPDNAMINESAMSERRMLDSMPNAFAVAITGPEGRFLLGGLAPQKYRLRAIQGPASQNYRSYRNEYRDKHNPLVALRANEDKEGVRLVFDPGLAIWGAVTDTKGNPLSKGTVYARSMPGIEFEATTELQGDGSYLIDGFPEVECFVSLTASAEAHILEMRDGVFPDSQEDFALEPCPIIQGRVIHADTGAPIPKFALRTWATPENRTREDEWVGLLDFDNVVEDDAGRFSIYAERYGDLTIGVRAKGFELAREYLRGIEPGDTVNDLVVHIRGGAVVKGVVRDTSGKVVAGARVFVGYPPPLIAAGRPTVAKAGEAISENDGSFELAGVSTETQAISAYHPSYAPGATSVTINPSVSTQVEIVLGEGGTLEGMVSLNGKPLDAGYSVVARFPDGKSGQKGTRAPKGGTYSISGLMPGVTVVHCEAGREGTQTSGFAARLEAEVEIAHGEITIADFDFVSGYRAAVEGTVTVDGTPFCGHILFWTYRDNGMREYFWIEIEDGYYCLENIPAGALGARVSGVVAGGALVEREFTVETRSGEVVRHDIEIER